jgi:hypothetical protein
MIVLYEVAVDDLSVGSGYTGASAFAVGDVSFVVGYAFTTASVIVRGAFAVGGMARGSEVVVGGDAIVGGGMIVAVHYGVAQELTNLIGADCGAKYSGVPDSVVVDAQSYVPVTPLPSAAQP